MQRWFKSVAIALAVGFNLPVPAQQKPAAVTSENGFVGSATCATCHDEEAKNFSANPHHRLALEHGNAGAKCESCHGPGQAHVEGGGDVTKIFNFNKASAKEVDEKCLGCHAGQHVNFEKSAHGESSVSCVSCHSIHHSQDKEQLLKAAQPALCFQCHADQKAQFNMPFHHKVNEGLMKCSDCHDPHGTFEKNQLRATAEQNAICTKCHMETAGPFVYEHPVVKTEGCLSCHSPHGSPNPRLLNVSNLNTLCLQCHSDINNANEKGALGAVSPTGPAHNQSQQFVACTNCHTQIHGSNVSNIYFQ
jgi:DmsE family decaheme c-type cytochrome